MSEIAFCVLPWPSVYRNLLTLGHLAASSCASAFVIRRQLLSPNPSASASVMLFEPHHVGAPAREPPPPDELDPPPPPPPHPATTAIAAASSATDALRCLPIPLMSYLLLSPAPRASVRCRGRGRRPRRRRWPPPRSGTGRPCSLPSSARAAAAA